LAILRIGFELGCSNFHMVDVHIDILSSRAIAASHSRGRARVALICICINCGDPKTEQNEAGK
jgi:hypothetical protein